MQKHQYFLLMLIFNIISFSSFAEENAESKNFIEKKYDDFIELKNDISNNSNVIKAKEIAEFVFLSENPIFQKYNHYIAFSYARSITKGDELNSMSGIYSAPTKLFMNGRTSVELGGFVGNVGYTATPNGAISHPDVSQIFGGIMHEFVLNFNYFYCTAGIGLFIRNTNSNVNHGDRIGSRVVFSEKFAIGKSFDRFNLELMYRHFSNGDITLVNGGYNFIGFELGFKF